MQRVKSLLAERERGASAVVIAIVMVVLLGFGAIAVDLGALWSDRKQLQNGADAGALAIAQACARSTSSPECVSGTNPTAQGFAVSNKVDHNASGVVTSLNTTTGPYYVTVRTTSTRQSLLAGVLGSTSNVISAQATASWTKQPDELTTLPIAVSLCQFNWQNGALEGEPLDGKDVLIKLMSNDDFAKKDFPKDADLPLPCINNDAHNEVGGGFGWLDADTATCTATISADDTVGGSPGVSTPNCSLNLTPGKKVIVPIFDGVGTEGDQVINGAKAEYHITGFAALELGGWHLVGSGGTEYNPWPGTSPSADPSSFFYSEKNPKSHIWGRFVGYSTLAEWKTSTGSTDFGVSVVSLSE